LRSTHRLDPRALARLLRPRRSIAPVAFFLRLQSHQKYAAAPVAILPRRLDHLVRDRKILAVRQRPKQPDEHHRPWPNRRRESYLPVAARLPPQRCLLHKEILLRVPPRHLNRVAVRPASL